MSAGKPLAIVNCGELVTLRGPAAGRRGAELSELGISRGGALLIVDGAIAEVGSAEDIRRQMPPRAHVIDATGKVVLPGFVDAHTHLVFGGSRIDEFERRARGESYESIAAAGGGIMSSVRATRAASEEDLLAGAQRHLSWCQRGGTTALEIKSGYGLTVEDELKMLRVAGRLGRETGVKIARTCLAAHAVPPEFAENRGAYVDLVMHEILPRAARERLADYADVFCDAIAFDADEARRIFKAARALGLGIRAHVDQLSSHGGASLAAECGAVTADHLEQTDAAGIAALAAAGVQPVLLPGSVYALGRRRYPAARAMIEAGLAVVLATDFNPGSSPVPSIPAVLSLAVTQMGMTPAEAIAAATINAAASLGWAGEIGSLERGKRADVVVHAVEDHRELAYWVGRETAEVVIVGGNVVLDRRCGDGR